MTTSTVAKKDISKLQRAIVDGLEDVKAQDIQVFDTEHLSALFERVVVARAWPPVCATPCVKPVSPNHGSKARAMANGLLWIAGKPWCT